MRMTSLAAWVLLSTAAAAPTVETSVCQIVRNPENYSGKTVRFRAQLLSGRRFVVGAEGCEGIVVALPTDHWVKPKARFSFERNTDWEKLQRGKAELVGEPGAARGEVWGVFEGRLDSLSIVKNGKRIERDPRALQLAPDDIRLVLKRVTGVEVKPRARAMPAHKGEQARLSWVGFVSELFVCGV